MALIATATVGFRQFSLGRFAGFMELHPGHRAGHSHRRFQVNLSIDKVCLSRHKLIVFFYSFQMHFSSLATFVNVEGPWT